MHKETSNMVIKKSTLSLHSPDLICHDNGYQFLTFTVLILLTKLLKNLLFTRSIRAQIADIRVENPPKNNLRQQ